MIGYVILTLYTFGVLLGNIYIFIGSFFSNKLRLLLNGRRSTLSLIKDKRSEFKDTVWVHCASLGEFEQGRPVIEAIKKNFPDKKVILSFFSPSGYEIRKHYELADEIFYLPSDLPSNVKLLVDYFNPKVFILIKYEFWWNLLAQLQNRNIATYLVSGVFRKDDYFLKPGLGVFRHILQKFKTIFVQDDISSRILAVAGIENVEIAGDTRIDRVIDHVSTATRPPKFVQYVQGKKTIIYGSIWMEDMPLVLAVIKKYPTFRHILAPHDISTTNIAKMSAFIDVKSNLYSDELWDQNVLFIDNIGLLSSLYSVANYVYIGGGFGKGIHNILEPAVYGIPVFFGPKYLKFNEAVQLEIAKVVFPVKTSDEFLLHIDELESNGEKLTAIKKESRAYFEKNKGATDKIILHLARFL